jgi:hypothetical protein
MHWHPTQIAPVKEIWVALPACQDDFCHLQALLVGIGMVAFAICLLSSWLFSAYDIVLPGGDSRSGK